MPISDTPIPNGRLTLDLIPEPESSLTAIWTFALTFDGYDEWGFHMCAQIANARLSETLTELRTCLFFEQRRCRHLDMEPDPAVMDYICGVLQSIRNEVTMNRHTVGAAGIEEMLKTLAKVKDWQNACRASCRSGRSTVSGISSSGSAMGSGTGGFSPSRSSRDGFQTHSASRMYSSCLSA